MKKKRALISVTEKAGLGELVKTLMAAGYEVISTGNTANALKELNFEVMYVADVTGFPEILDGRVKTLHPRIFAGLLADLDKPSHREQMAEHGIEAISMVVVNLYDFAGNPGIEQIDVGGPSMIRAAAKNHAHVSVVINPHNYHLIIREIEVMGELSPKTRKRLAAEAFEYTSTYDRVIADWMWDQLLADS